MKKKFFLGILESFLYCLIVYLIFFHFSNFKHEFLSMNMQPLIIVVGGMALKYGVYISLQTVIVAISFYIYAYYKLGNDPVVFFLDFSVYKFILIFFFVSLVLGRFSDNLKEKNKILKKKNINLEQEIEEQRKKNIDLVEINDRIKLRIVGSKESILTLHQITSSILTKNVEKIFTQVLEILINFLGGDVVSIYMYNKRGNSFRARIKAGNSVIPNFFQVKDGDIYSKLLESKEVVEGNRKKEIIDPVYSAPILKDDEVIGIINIERLKYGNEEKYILELFKVISQWINTALVNAFEKAEQEIIKNSFYNTRIYNLEYFNYILDEDKKRKKLFGTEYLALECENPGLIPEELNEKIKGKVRDIDVVGMSNKSIKFLFVNANKANKNILIDRVSEIIPGVELYEI